MRFIGNWIADSIRLALALALAVAAMQIPAIAQSYHSALLQVASATERDIAERQQIARDYYRLPPDTAPEGIVETLRRSEPANAAGLTASGERAAVLRIAAGQLDSHSPLLRPVFAFWDGLTDSRAGKTAILRETLRAHGPAILLGAAPASYGLAGLMTGLLLARILLSPFSRRYAVQA